MLQTRTERPTSADLSPHLYDLAWRILQNQPTIGQAIIELALNGHRHTPLHELEQALQDKGLQPDHHDIYAVYALAGNNHSLSLIEFISQVPLPVSEPNPFVTWFNGNETKVSTLDCPLRPDLQYEFSLPESLRAKNPQAHVFLDSYDYGGFRLLRLYNSIGISCITCKIADGLLRIRFDKKAFQEKIATMATSKSLFPEEKNRLLEFTKTPHFRIKITANALDKQQHQTTEHVFKVIIAE